MIEKIKMYAIKNVDGRWWESYSQRRRTGWVDDLIDARFFVRKHHAIAKRDVLMQTGQECDIVEFDVTRV